VHWNASITGDVYGGRAHNASLRNIVNIADGVTVTGPDGAWTIGGMVNGGRMLAPRVFIGVSSFSLV